MPSSAPELMPVIENLPVLRHLDRVQGAAVGQPEQEVRPVAPNSDIGRGLLGDGRALGVEVACRWRAGGKFPRAP
jgi:hypothetical protein